MGRRLLVFWVSRRLLQWLFLVVCVLLTIWLVIYWWSRLSQPALEPSAATLSGKIVVIDPGHGGYDPGAVAADGTMEKDVVLQIAYHLQRLLNRAAVYTILTRETDDDLSSQKDSRLVSRKRQDLQRRVEIANQARADLFISIHCNSFPQSIWSGAQTFFYPGREKSKKLAVAIQAELVRRLGPNRRRANAGEYRVLKDTIMPAVVVEAGFLSNPREARLLARKDYQKKLAVAIYHGIVRYLLEAENREKVIPFAFMLQEWQRWCQPGWERWLVTRADSVAWMICCLPMWRKLCTSNVWAARSEVMVVQVAQTEVCFLCQNGTGKDRFY